MHLGERDRRVGDILEYLHAERGVERGVFDGERRCLAFVVRGVRVRHGTSTRGREHLRAAVDPDDRPGRADVLDQLRVVEPWPTPDVEDPLAGAGVQRFSHEPPPP